MLHLLTDRYGETQHYQVKQLLSKLGGYANSGSYNCHHNASKIHLRMFPSHVKELPCINYSFTF